MTNPRIFTDRELEELRTNPLLLYLSTELAVQAVEITSLKEEQRLNRATIVNMQDRIDRMQARHERNTAVAQSLRDLIADLDSRLDHQHRKLEAMSQVIDAAKTRMTRGEVGHLIEDINVAEQDFDTELTDIILFGVDSDTDLDMDEIDRELDAFWEMDYTVSPNIVQGP